MRFGFVFNQKTVLMSMYSQDGVTGNRITALPEITEKKKKNWQCRIVISEGRRNEVSPQLSQLTARGVSEKKRESCQLGARVPKAEYQTKEKLHRQKLPRATRIPRVISSVLINIHR